ncbi:metallophosphoesterase [bacterium]|nr:metallophosphoesterase [Verrucomicrobiales bacterium]MDC0312185.1 metallophosphoesterase [bacterium]MDC0314205.1 metallophosphoesterase [bacterium]MDC0322607.1 metallophosphoesterase [Verrucomicrobiales bacterium]
MKATHIIHISDTHFGPEREFTVRGAPVLERSQRLVTEINALPFTPDAIVHTGDVVNDPDEAAYKIAKDVFSDLSVPVYYATGNHDDVMMMREHLDFGALDLLVPESEHRLCYRAQIGAIEAIVLDAKVLPEEGPHGFLPQNQLDALSTSIAGSDRPFAVFIHFPARPIGAKWIDENLPVKNGDALHSILKSAPKNKFLGMFFGHLHRGMQIYDEGILYSAVSSPACQFTAGPDEEGCGFLPDVPVCFNHISISERGATQVKEYSFNS